MRVRASIISSVVVVLLIVTGVYAAEGSGQPAASGRQSVTGTVNDALGRPIAGVGLILESVGGKILGHATSDKSGRFQFRHVAPGTYMIVANHGGFKTGASTVTVTASGAPPLTIALEAETALSLAVTAKRLEAARNGLSPETGSSVYRFSEQAIQQLPQGANTQMSGVLLAGPERCAGLLRSDSISAASIRRSSTASTVSNCPRASPPGFRRPSARASRKASRCWKARYPRNTAITPRASSRSRPRPGASLNGGDIDMYGGQRDTLQPSFELGGTERQSQLLHDRLLSAE